MRKESLEEVDDLVEPEGISKVLEEPSREVIRRDGCDLSIRTGDQHGSVGLSLARCQM
jgi:hypothetical protein